MNRLQPPADFDDIALRDCVEARHLLVVKPATNLAVSYLDTHDWQLHRSGLVLTEESGPRRRLVLLRQAHAPFVIPIRSTPRFAADLPPGYLADLIGPVMGIRALIPVGAAAVSRCDGRIENADGDILTLLRLETVDPLDRAGTPVGPAARFLGLSDPGILDLTFETAPEHDLEATAAARGRRPRDYSSKLRIPLEPDQPAEASIRIILLDLLDALDANVDGTIADLDTEFLHDLRVACRRTRSALTQLKGVLPADLVAPFNAEFKWLGGVTGRLRDLDVYQLEMPVYREMLPSEAGDELEPLEKLIAAERRRAHRAVVRALRSPRFHRLQTSWREVLEADEPAETHRAEMPTHTLAAERITKAYRRILKKGRGLGDDPPAEALHRIRIDAKKLRYLLEFFKNLYPKSEIAARIKELKQLQDILGGFNDMEIQRDRLTDFASALHADPKVATSCILTLGRLAGTLEERQESYRMAFHNAFAEFSSPPVRRAFKRLFGGKETT